MEDIYICMALTARIQGFKIVLLSDLHAGQTQ